MPQLLMSNLAEKEKAPPPVAHLGDLKPLLNPIALTSKPEIPLGVNDILKPEVPLKADATLDIKYPESTTDLIQHQNVPSLNSIVEDPLGGPDTLNMGIFPYETPIRITPEKPDILSQYDDVILRASDRYHIPPSLIKSVMFHESRGKPGAVSPAGAMGLMQLMPDTARGLGVTKPFDPEQSIYGGAKYLRQVADRIKSDDPMLIAAGYNAGPGSVIKYGGLPPFSETQKYAPAVTETYNRLRNGESLQSIITEQPKDRLPPLIDYINKKTKEPEENLFEWFLSPFISTAHAEESPNYRIFELRKQLQYMSERSKSVGGFNGLSANQQGIAKAAMDELKMLEAAPGTKDLKTTFNVEVDKQQVRDKKGLYYDYGDQAKSWFGTLLDMSSMNPLVYNKIFADAIGLPNIPVASPLMEYGAKAANSFQRSMFEKFTENVSISFVRGNVEKPQIEQNSIERLSGLGGSVFGTILGFTIPWIGLSKGIGTVGLGVAKAIPWLKSSNQLMGIVGKLAKEMLAGYGIGSMEAVSRGDAGPMLTLGKLKLSRAEVYAATPFAFKAIPEAVGLPFRVINFIRDRSLRRFVEGKFVPSELNYTLDLAKESKSFDEFYNIVLGAKDRTVKYLQNYFNENKRFSGSADKLAYKTFEKDTQKFYSEVQSNKLNSLEDTIREYIGTLFKSKKDIKISNYIEKAYKAGINISPEQKMTAEGTLVFQKPKPVRTFLGMAVDIFGKYVASVLRKIDPTTKIPDMEYAKYADERKIIGGYMLAYDKVLETYGKENLNLAIQVLENKFFKDFPEQLQKSGLGMDDVIKYAQHLENIGKTLGETAKSVGVEMYDPVTKKFGPLKLLTGHFPHTWSKKNLQKFMKIDADDPHALSEFLTKTGQAKSISQAIVQLDELFTEFNASLRPYLKSFQFPRRANLPGYRMDENVIREHIAAMAERIAFAKNYGPTGEKLKEEAARLIAKGGNEWYVKEAMQLIAGKAPVTAFGRIMQFMRAANFFLFGPGTTAINLSGSMQIPVQTGMANFLKGITSQVKNYNLVRQSGALNSESLNQVAKMQVGADFADNWIGRLQQKYSKLIYWVQSELHNRSRAASTGIETIKGLFKQYLATPNDTVLRDMLHAGLTKKTAAAAIKRGFLNKQDLIAAAQRLEYDTQFWYMVTDLPLFFSTELGKTLTQFKSSAYLYTMFLKKQVYDEFKRGNAKPLFMWAAVGNPTNEIVQDVRDIAAGRNPFDKDSSHRPGIDDPFKRSIHNLLVGGQGTGILGDPIQAFQSYKNGRDDAMYAYLGGPTATQVQDFVDVFADFQNYWDKGELTPSKAGKRTLTYFLTRTGLTRGLPTWLHLKDESGDSKFEKKMQNKLNKFKKPYKPKKF